MKSPVSPFDLVQMQVYTSNQVSAKDAVLLQDVHCKSETLLAYTRVASSTHHFFLAPFASTVYT